MRRITVYQSGTIHNRRNSGHYIMGELHRLDGPAYINGNYEEYWIAGSCYKEREYKLLKNKLEKI